MPTLLGVNGSLGATTVRSLSVDDLRLGRPDSEEPPVARPPLALTQTDLYSEIRLRLETKGYSWE